MSRISKGFKDTAQGIEQQVISYHHYIDKQLQVKSEVCLVNVFWITDMGSVFTRGSKQSSVD